MNESGSHYWSLKKTSKAIALNDNRIAMESSLQAHTSTRFRELCGRASRFGDGSTIAQQSLSPPAVTLGNEVFVDTYSVPSGVSIDWIYDELRSFTTGLLLVDRRFCVERRHCSSSV